MSSVINPNHVRKVLFFTADWAATPEELATAATIDGQIQMRNSLIPAVYGEKLEDAYGLAGAIPANYLTGEGDTVDTAIFPGGDMTPVEEEPAP